MKILQKLGKVLGKYHEKQWSLRINAHEDNTTMLTVAATGKNPTMKTLERNHGVSVAWIHKQVQDGVYNFVHTRTEHMTADLFIKPFSNAETWRRLKQLVNVYSPAQREQLDFQSRQKLDR